jgi:hypothetical protein
LRLLAKRESHGILVKLFWDEDAATGSGIVVEYGDRCEDVWYVVRPPRDRALDAYYHPNAYRKRLSLDAYSVKV